MKTTRVCCLLVLMGVQTLSAKMIDIDSTRPQESQTAGVKRYQSFNGMVSGLLTTVAYLPEPMAYKDKNYREGRTALDASNWVKAIRLFEKVIEAEGEQTEAAMYWRAYALSKDNRHAEALEALADLRKNFPRGQWLEDAQTLARQIRGDVGDVTDDGDENESMKMMALMALISAPPEQAVPRLKKILAGAGSDELKGRALFVLGQIAGADSVEILRDVAKGGSHPQLQGQAIQYLGIAGGEANQNYLTELYGTLADKQLKGQILNSLMISGGKAGLVKIAQSESDPELKANLIHQLGLTQAFSELEAMYRESTPAEAKAILHAMFLGGNKKFIAEAAKTAEDPEVLKAAIKSLGLSQACTELEDLYNSFDSVDAKAQVLHAVFLSGGCELLKKVVENEQNPELKKAAIKSMGLSGKGRFGEVLQNVYRQSDNKEIRMEVLNALFLQQNAKALITLAREEKDPALRKAAIQKLAITGSDEAIELLDELLDQK